MGQTSDRRKGPRRGVDWLTRAVQIALVIYLTPVLLVTFAIGLIVMGIVHLALLTTLMLPHSHRATIHRPSVAMSARIGGNRSGSPPLA